MTCAAVYLLVCSQNPLVHLAEKTLLIQPLTFGGDYRGEDHGKATAPDPQPGFSQGRRAEGPEAVRRVRAG